MLRSSEPKHPAPTCAVCAKAGTIGEVWGHHVCGACHTRWQTEVPTLATLELAHADAHPEDVEQHGEHRSQVTGSVDERWVILKADVSARIAKAATDAWVRGARKLKVVP